MTHPTMPALPPIPPEPPATRKRTLKLTVVALVTCGAFFTGGYFTGLAVEDDDTKTDARPSAADTHDPDPETDIPFSDVVPNDDESYASVDESSFTIELTTKSKQCFGSAGCNLVVEPELGYNGLTEELDPDATYSITYEITGGDDGPVIETLELTEQTQITFDKTVVSTATSSAELSVEITSVSEY